MARGVEYFTAERRRQREVVAAVAKLKANLRRDDAVPLDLDGRRIAGDLLIMLMRQASARPGFPLRFIDTHAPGRYRPPPRCSPGRPQQG